MRRIEEADVTQASSGGDRKDVLDIAVIGAGFSGLAAARALSAAGLERIALLEARDRVGGRAFNGHVAGGFPVEMGGTWCGPGQWAVIDLAEELGIALRPQYASGDEYAIVEGQAMRTPPTKVDERFVAELDALVETVPIEAPWTALRAAEWDAMTYADYLADANLSEDDRAAVDMATLVSFAALPDTISFLYMLYYLHAAGGYNRLEGIEDGRQRWQRFAGGSQVIALEMAAALGEIVRLSSPVTEIRGWDGAGPVELVTAKGTVTARRAVLALSPSQAAGIRFGPALPASKAGLIEAWPRSGASGIKTFVSYDKPFWRARGLSGSIYNFDGTYAWAADASPDDESIGVLGTLGLTGDGLTTEQRKQAILESFAKCFGPEALEPTAYVEHDWGQETYTQGCVSPLAQGVLTSYGPALRAATGRLLWAGTETALRWTGYLDGAIRAGRNAATEALVALAQEG
jgi:monoamine oxidase